MSFCSKCGGELEEGVKFCPSCGASVEKETVRPQPRYTDQREACFGPKGSGGGFWGAISGGVFLIGLVLLWYFDFWWPGIIILIALMVIIGGLVSYSRR